MPRAEKFTAKSKQLIYYSDINVTFETKPTSGELDTVVNEESVKQSIKYLILTSFGEVPYNPTRGSKIKTGMFEPNDELALDQITELIRDTCKQEPRAEIRDILVKNVDENTIAIKIAFTIVNLTGSKELELDLLTRIR